MALEMVLNDLSLLPFAENAWIARQRMEKLVGTLQAATKLGAARILRTDNDINIVELAPGYSIAHWRNDPDVDRETRQYFRRLITKAPYLDGVDDLQIQDAYYLSTFSHNEKKAIGLAMAFLLNALAISFHSHSTWETRSLQLSLEQLQEDATFTIDIVSVQHACFRDHVLEHCDWISKRAQRDIQCGTDLWTYRELLYPHLQFCSTVADNMQKILHGDIRLNHVMKHLQRLNNYYETWLDGPFSKQAIALDISTESQVTLQKYSQQRTFIGPDNIPIVFSWHSKDKFINWRIHFHPVEHEQLIIIGYIGGHLPTVKYPT